MAINKKLIHFKKYETFNGSQGINGATEPTNGMYGNIPEHSIVFILDAKKIWTHGQLYDCDLSALEEIGLIKELIEEIQNTLKKEDPYWEYYEYEHVPLTIEALGDGTIEFIPYLTDKNVIEGSLDGGKTWVNITNNPIQLVSGDKLLLKGSVIGHIDYDDGGTFQSCGYLETQFPYNAFGNPSLLLKRNSSDDDIDYEYIFSALLAVLFAQTGLVMHKLLEQHIEGFETLSFKEKVIAIFSMMTELDPSEEELLQAVSSLQRQYGAISFLEAVSTICNALQSQVPDLNVDEDFLLTVFKGEFGEDVTLHDIVAMLCKQITGSGNSHIEEYPFCTFDNLLENNMISAENLYVNEYTTSIFSAHPTLQIAPKVLDLERYSGISFRYMFRGCTALTKAPALPATKLSEECYASMFSGCKSLTIAPELPATILAERCYSSMFSGCTALTTAPKLPATILSKNCYHYMFLGCDSLTTAPELPALTLAYGCYNNMFSECTSLTSIPELPATILADYCYCSMFNSCVKLENADIILPALILLDYCYERMFYGCTSLTVSPKLPAITLSKGCYKGMFEKCTSLVTAPELLVTTLADYCYYYMFSRCTNLSYIKMLAKNIQATSCLTDFAYKVAAEGTFVKTKGVDIPTGDDGIPEGWTVIEEESIESLSSEVGNLSSEIDILKNRIISTTYSELKDAVTNSTLTTGQYYRITDYVTTCNGTSAKVEDASTIDPANPVDGQSRSAGHQFDIIVRALSSNQLDENAVAVRHEGDTYYPEDFDGTVIKYFIENKEFSEEDGKGTIFYMKDHNNNECPYDFTNVQYYSTNENIETGWYYTFSNGVDSYYTRAHDNLITPTEFHELPNIILITPEAIPMTMYDNHITLDSYNLLISGLGILSNKISSTLNINLIAKGVILTNNIYLLLTSNFITDKYISSNYIFSCSNILCNCTNYIVSNLWNNCRIFTLNCGTVLNNNFLLGTTNVTVNGGDCVYTTTSEYCKNITACSLYYMTFETATNIQITAINGEYPKFCRVGVNTTCSNITISGGILATTISGRYLNIIGSGTSVSSVHNTIHEVRGASDTSRLTLTLNNSGPHKKDIYSDVSGRIFHVWEDNGIKKGYYLNSNTDTLWKEYSEDVNFITSDERDKLNNSVQSVSVIGGQEYIEIDVNRGEFNDVEVDIDLNVSTNISASSDSETGLYLADAAAVKKYVEDYVSTNYISNAGGTISGNLYAGSSILYEEGGIDLVSGTIEASEVNDFSYVRDSQGNNLLEVLDTKAEIYTITDFSAYDVDNIAKGRYTLQINPSPLEGAIRNNKVILIQHELGMEASPVLDAYIEDLIYLTVMYNSCIYLVFIELDLTVLTSASIDCMYNKTDLITDSVTISNAMTITKDNSDYAHLNISEGLTIDNLVEWTDGSDTTASINYDGSASFTNLSVAGKNVTSFLTHYNSDINVVRSLTNIPTDKAVVFAHINSSQELTFDDANLVSGRGVHVFIYNYLTEAITVILPSGVGIYECDNITEFEISPRSIAEVNMIYLSSWESGYLKFIRSITV